MTRVLNAAHPQVPNSRNLSCVSALGRPTPSRRPPKKPPLPDRAQGSRPLPPNAQHPYPETRRIAPKLRDLSRSLLRRTGACASGVRGHKPPEDTAPRGRAGSRTAEVLSCFRLAVCTAPGISRSQTGTQGCQEGRRPAAGPGSRSPFPAGPARSGCFGLPGLPPQGPLRATA